MLLQTNSYIVPRDKHAEHARLMRRFRQVLARLGCDMFEVYEQVGSNWGSGDEKNRRCVQIIRFRDRKHQGAVQNAEKNDPAAQALIAEFCELVNFPYQQQQGYFTVGFFNSVLSTPSGRGRDVEEAPAESSLGEMEPMVDEATAPTESAPADTAAASGAAEPMMDMVEGHVVRHDDQEAAPQTARDSAEVLEHGHLPELPSPEPEEFSDGGPPLEVERFHDEAEPSIEGDLIDGHEAEAEPLSDEELLGELSNNGEHGELEHHQGHEGELGTQKSDEPIEDGALEHGDDGEDADHPAPGDPERRRASAFRRPPHRG